MKSRLIELYSRDSLAGVHPDKPLPRPGLIRTTLNQARIPSRQDEGATHTSLPTKPKLYASLTELNLAYRLALKESSGPAEGESLKRLNFKPRSRVIYTVLNP